MDINISNSKTKLAKQRTQIKADQPDIQNKTLDEKTKLHGHAVNQTKNKKKPRQCEYEKAEMKLLRCSLSEMVYIRSISSGHKLCFEF